MVPAVLHPLLLTQLHDRTYLQVESLFVPPTGANASSSSSSSNDRLHLHYSFPPFSVGELGKSGLPNRREIGHGNLAKAGLVGIMPAAQEFPFTIRVTADTLGSSGSSSMAAVCAGSMALKAAGVPIQALAAGISIGLVTEQPPQLEAAVQADPNEWLTDSAAISSSDSSGSSGYSSIVNKGPVQQQKPQEAAAAESSNAEQPEPDNNSSSSSGVDAVSDAEPPSRGLNSSSSSSTSDSGNHLLTSSYGTAVLLTDIQGIEDHHGDMDFKVGPGYWPQQQWDFSSGRSTNITGNHLFCSNPRPAQTVHCYMDLAYFKALLLGWWVVGLPATCMAPYLVALTSYRAIRLSAFAECGKCIQAAVQTQTHRQIQVLH